MILLLVLAVVGFGAFGIATGIQRHAAEVAAETAAQEQAAAEKKRLAAQYVRPSKLGKTLLASSTPRSAWKQGSMPHLYQVDPIWSEQPYAGGTVRANACGPTSLAMVYIYLTGKTDQDPATLATFAERNNFSPTGATEWAFMTQGAAMLGIHSAQIHPTRSEITNALSSGMPVICSVHPGDFTSVGHFIVLKSIDDAGRVEVHDPNSPYNSAQPWDIERILGQTNACWSFWL